MIWRRVLLNGLIRRRTSKKRKVRLSVGKTINKSSVKKSRTSTVERKEERENSCKDIIGFKRKRNGGVVNTAHDFVDEIPESSSRKCKSCSNDGGRSSPECKGVELDSSSDDRIVESVDMISELPDPILHMILFLLHCPKDLARASTLSRRWRQVCSSFSVLKFDQRKFSKKVAKKNGSFMEIYEEIREESKLFREFVSRSLQNYIQHQLPLNTIMLHMTTQDTELAISLDQWLKIAADNNIRELDLHFPLPTNASNFYLVRFCLPQTVYRISTITSLKLSGCKLGNCTEINLPNLKKLCLSKLPVSESIIERMLLSFPLIEDLRLIYCSSLKKLLVPGLSKLNKLELHLCQDLNSVQVEAPNLETFWYHDGRKSMFWLAPFKIDLVKCTSLKSLSLEDAGMEDEAFQDLFSNFSLLELLELRNCHSLRSIRISNQVLKRLVLRGCKHLENADIDAPNLRSFEFMGNKRPPLSWDPHGLKEAKFAFGFAFKDRFKNPDRLRKADLYWLAKLHEFLGKIDHSKGLKLLVRYNQNVIIHEDMKEILIPPIYDVNIEIVKASKGFEDIIYSLLSTWHPETLSLVSSINSTLPQMILGLVDRRDDYSSCCRYTAQSNKCWRHFLKNVKMEDLEPTREKRTSFLNSWWKSSPTVHRKTTHYRLSWITKETSSNSIDD